MYYIIQENLFQEVHHKTIIQTLERMGLHYEIVKFRPFTHELEFKTKRKDVWCWGSDTMARQAAHYGWKPGSMCSQNHDYELYAPAYGYENMLNTGMILEFGEELWDGIEGELKNMDQFIRPTQDSKFFPAKVYTIAEWNDYVKHVKAAGHTSLLTDQTKILVSEPKNIQQEVRCWIVDGKVITTSLYRRGEYGRPRVNYDHEKDFWNFAQSMADKYSPAKAYVMDICLAYDEFKIVEINCINASGFYDANVQQLITALEETFNPEPDHHEEKTYYGKYQK